MKRVLFALICLTFAVFAQHSQAETLTVTTVERPPFSYVDEGEDTGFSMDLLAALAEELDWGYTVVRVDAFGDMLSAVENREADMAIANISITAGREARSRQAEGSQAQGREGQGRDTRARQADGRRCTPAAAARRCREARRAEGRSVRRREGRPRRREGGRHDRREEGRDEDRIIPRLSDLGEGVLHRADIRDELQFGLRQITLLVTEAGEALLQVQRNRIVDRTTNLVGSQRLQNVIALAASNSDAVLVVNVLAISK